MWELDHKESWMLKSWCFWTVVLEKTLASPLNFEKVKPVNPKGNQSWIFFGRTDADVEAPILWPPNAKNWFTGKDTEAGKDWRQEEKGTTEAEMVGWHHQFDGHEFEQAQGVDDWQGSLECCSSWGPKELDTTKRLHFDFSLSGIGKGNGNPLQCSCLENPMDGGDWWAAIYGVAQTWTRLKQLSSSSSSSSSSPANIVR